MGIGYRFKDISLYHRALSHKSFGPDNNERLEFLGDTVLNFLTSRMLYDSAPTTGTMSLEGRLSEARTCLVSNSHLADCARNIGLGAELLLGRGEDNDKGRDKTSILSDAMEALIAAIYLDGGLLEARNFCSRFIWGRA